MEDSQTLGPDSLDVGHLDKYNPGTAGDMARTIKTKQKTIVYDDTPLEMKKSQFEKMARRSGIDVKVFARNILDSSWCQKLNLIRQEFSCDKQVVKLLEKAETDHRDQERDTGVRQLSYNNLSLPHTHGKRKRPIDKESKSRLTEGASVVSAPMKDETHFYSSDEDDDNLLAAAFHMNEEVEDTSTSGDKTFKPEIPMSSTSDRPNTIAKSPEPKIMLTQIVKPAPPGQFYKKKIICDNDFACDAVERNESPHVLHNSTSSKKTWNEEDLNIDSIFSSPSYKTKPSDKPKIYSDKRVQEKKDSCVDISIDDIFD